MQTFSLKQQMAARMLQTDIPLTPTPFQDIANACDLSATDLLNWLRELSRQGTIRKFGAVLRHQKAGYHKNALVMWSLPSGSIENTGRLFAALPYISHCYQREPAFQHKYNLFTMLHAQDETIKSLIHKMSETAICHDFLVLESIQEYKKTSPEYF